MVMPHRPSSSGMQNIRRELQRRRPKPLAPKSSVAMKSSAPPPPCESPRYTSREPRPRPPSEKIPSSFAAQSRCRAGTDAPQPRPHASRCPPVASRPTPPSWSAVSSAPGAAAHLRPGTAVGVRTRTTTLKTGEALVLWLKAMVVSPTQEGYEIVYDGNWPPSDPYGTVHVPRRHVRMMNPSPTTPPPPPSFAAIPCASATTAAVPAAQKKETQPAPRPTRAGKSLRLIRRSLLPEMERQARADSHGYY
ncbi:hypothetical protein SETIT_2G317700v2 [Setaria italica]|uniref:Uncharacterized protein n=3 Tax=Setaria italica TaxID=4555 RepID=A0A368Q5H2_SETIT|nr:extensin [Setaria italica]XP_012699186.1 extensin [Setaria italica]RCV13064.1 hypothetical protein SETIT_2G316800v2 [Setaria italica]RCV13077.1 hypothetical protein SETIT_2G317700v2 [Setaria italica]